MVMRGKVSKKMPNSQNYSVFSSLSSTDVRSSRIDLYMSSSFCTSSSSSSLGMNSSGFSQENGIHSLMLLTTSPCLTPMQYLT